jgi:hypothetical protein
MKLRTDAAFLVLSEASGAVLDTDSSTSTLGLQPAIGNIQTFHPGLQREIAFWADAPSVLPHRRQHGIGKLGGAGRAAHVPGEGLALRIDGFERLLDPHGRRIFVQVVQHQNG